MDSISLIKSNDQHLRIDATTDDDALGGDSNSETDFATEQGDHEMMGTISTSVSRLASSFHESSSSGGDIPQLLHSSTNSRANFSQFETPADETRNNFGPDDFDEQLFIGQLATTCTETRRFDEEIESQVIMDTADHSESSDVEDLFSNGSSNNLPHQPEDKTYHECSSSNDLDDSITSPRISNLDHSPRNGAEEEARGQRHDRVKLTLPKVTKKDFEGQDGDEDDLISDNAIDTEDGKDNHHRIPVCLNLINSVEPGNAERQQSVITHTCATQSHVKSSPLRKRKGEMGIDSPEETLPSKKPVTTEVYVDDYSEPLETGGDHDQLMDSPEEEDDEEEDEEILEVGYDDGPSSPNSYENEGSPSDAASSVPSGSSVRSVIPSKAHPPPRMSEWMHIFAGWSHPERLMAITELIGLCEATQVRHMMQIIEPQFQRDFISLLPKELALYVLSFLDPRDLLRAAQTCKYWQILADDNLLWREKCKEAGVGYFSAMSNRVHRRSRTNNNAQNQPPPVPPPEVPITRWKASFMKQHHVEMNWKRKDTGDHKVLKGHDDHVITCLQFSGHRIVSGSDDNTLKVWSATTGKCLRTLLGHTGGVWSSQMSGATIVSGSTDRTLRVWNADNGQCLHTLYGHTSTVRCMHLHGRKVVSGSRDATLRMWDVETGECLHVLVGHMAAVRCVQYNGHLVVSGAYDYMVRIWDPEREECLHQLSGHTNRVYSLQFDGIHVVSGSLDTSIRVWDVESGACKHTLMGHQSLTSGMELRDNLLVSGNADSTVKIWDISTGQCLLTLTGPNKHLSAVTCLQLINKFVITSSDDGTVKLWDIRSGDFVRNLVSLSSGGSGGVVWRIRSSETKLVCAVGSRNGTEETKLLVLDFDTEETKPDPKIEGRADAQCQAPDF